MEQQIRIKTPDKKVIYGTLNGASKEKLVIFVHGLTGHQNEHMFYNAACFFPKYGYSTFRFDLYSDEKGARRFVETTVSIHAKDVDTVVSYFAKKYKRIYLVGHSLGGPSILLSSMQGVAGIVLWDPSEGLKEEPPGWCTYDRGLDAYVIHWNTDIIMSKEFYEDFMALPLMAGIVEVSSAPTKVILAGDSTLRKWWTRTPGRIVVPGASHCFDEEGSEEQLFRHTLAFLRKH